jgi:hypothetical protein
VATTTQVIEDMADCLGWTRPVVAHYADRLRNPGFGGSPDIFPVSGKGGGRSAVHVGARPLANLIMAFGAIGPSGAVDAQARLRRLHCEPGRRKSSPPPASRLAALAGLTGSETTEATPAEILKRTFGERIEAIIIDVAQAHRRPDGGGELERLEAQALRVSLSPDRRGAWVQWRDAAGFFWADNYGEPQPDLLLRDLLLNEKPTTLSRSTVLEFPIFKTAGRLLADTLDSEAATRSRRGTSTPKSKTPGQQGRALLTGRQGQQDPAETLNDSETTRERDGAQLDRARRLFALPDQPSNHDGKGMSDGHQPHSPCVPAA